MHGICFSHGTADRVLERCAHEGIELEPVSSSVLEDFVSECVGTRETLDHLGIPLGESIELLVGKPSLRKYRGTIATHLLSQLPPEGSILRINEGIYVVSPELCLLQQASQLHPVNLCQMLGRYLGSSSPVQMDNGVTRLAERPSLTDEERIASLLRGAKSRKGRGILLDAMAWTCSGAASPQETNLQLTLTLPPRFGGFGLNRPLLNETIELGEKARRLYPHGSVKVDLLLKEVGFGLEYQGKEHGDQLDEDYARFLAVHREGIELWFVANGQLRDAYQMSYIAEEIARRTGRRIGGLTWPTVNEVQWLLDVLSGVIIPRPNERFSRKRSRQ